jgi:hypothetical protein
MIWYTSLKDIGESNMRQNILQIKDLYTDNLKIAIESILGKKEIEFELCKVNFKIITNCCYNIFYKYENLVQEIKNIIDCECNFFNTQEILKAFFGANYCIYNHKFIKFKSYIVMIKLLIYDLYNGLNKTLLTIE